MIDADARGPLRRLDDGADRAVRFRPWSDLATKRTPREREAGADDAEIRLAGHRADAVGFAELAGADRIASTRQAIFGCRCPHNAMTPPVMA